MGTTEILLTWQTRRANAKLTGSPLMIRKVCHNCDRSQSTGRNPNTRLCNFKRSEVNINSTCDRFSADDQIKLAVERGVKSIELVEK